MNADPSQAGFAACFGRSLASLGVIERALVKSKQIGRPAATVIAGVTVEDLRVFADAWNRHDVDALTREPDSEGFFEKPDRP